MNIESSLENIVEEITEENTEEDLSNFSLSTKNTNFKKRKYSGEEASNTNNIQTRKIKQLQITKHFNSITSLPIVKANELDQTILKAWKHYELKKKIDTELEKSNHLTISLDGWTSSRHDSIYNYIITTSTRKEYLIKLKSYNVKKQTGTFIAEEV
ncbi:7484_t:CDS:2 [Diversispora eburnea]|uniref:7484_t:CDS:1 n=1 Tax=Diversispora eburnea TaxID=1213867 RepID=A0A9N9FTX3_9GLOM|nr:7484_t:CDS:2 [Diversispora eburnea]